MTLTGLYRKGVALLGGTPEALLEAKVLLLAAARISESRFLSAPGDLADAGTIARFSASLEKRLSGRPLSYITGSKEFWSLDFRVSPSVLIPRPDTEVLVEKVLELSKRSGETIIDVGTGSGNIAVALAKEMPKSTIYAVDISKRALRVARSNAARLGTGNIEFRLSNLFYAFRGTGILFDFVVSNPPYISRKDWEALPPDIRDQEPKGALMAGESGLEAIERLIKRSRKYIKPGGYLVFEFGDGQRDDVLGLFGPDWTEIETAWDLAGLPRAITARKA